MTIVEAYQKLIGTNRRFRLSHWDTGTWIAANAQNNIRFTHDNGHTSNTYYPLGEEILDQTWVEIEPLPTFEIKRKAEGGWEHITLPLTRLSVTRLIEILRTTYKYERPELLVELQRTLDLMEGK